MNFEDAARKHSRMGSVVQKCYQRILESTSVSREDPFRDDVSSPFHDGGRGWGRASQHSILAGMIFRLIRFFRSRDDPSEQRCAFSVWFFNGPDVARMVLGDIT